MNKTVVAIVMSCAPIFAAGASPMQCPAGKAVLQFESSKRSTKEHHDDHVMSFNGRMPMSMKQLRGSYSLNDVFLEVGYANSVKAAVPATQIDAGPDGLTCIMFERWRGGSNANAIISISTIGRDSPRICIGADGTMSSSLMVTASALFSSGPFISMYVEGGDRNNTTLFDSRIGECVASCPSGKTKLRVVTSGWNQTGPGVAAVVDLVGQAPSSLKNLRARADLSRSYLEVGQSSTYFGTRLPARLGYLRARERDDGSVCMVFDSYDRRRAAGTGLDNVADAKESEPNVCINAEGVISARLKVDISGDVATDPVSPGVYVRVGLPDLSTREEVMLVNANTEGCTK